MNAFSILLGRCGLSQQAAAAALGVRPDTIKSWSSGRRDAPKAVIDELRAFHRVMLTEAFRLRQEIARLVDGRDPSTVAIGIPLAADDADAAKRRLPAAGVYATAVGEAITALEDPDGALEFIVEPVAGAAAPVLLGPAAAAGRSDRAGPWRGRAVLQGGAPTA